VGEFIVCGGDGEISAMLLVHYLYIDTATVQVKKQARTENRKRTILGTVISDSIK
jgi:hypothetical protein